jgi:hypothetical protein
VEIIFVPYITILVLVGECVQWIVIQYSSGRIVLIQKLEFYKCKTEEHYFMNPIGNQIVND